MVWIAVACLIVSITFYGFAAQWIISNIAQGIVQLPQPSLTLKLNPTTIYLGENFTLTATLTPAIEGKQITFSWNDTNLIANATTDSAGIATINFTPSAIGTYNFTAGHLIP